jgi:hypothetical protein
MVGVDQDQDQGQVTSEEALRRRIALSSQIEQVGGGGW